VPKEPNARDAKLIQYLTEAYGKEKELETALEAHIAMTEPKPYKKRLQDHLKITKAQSKGLERRIKQLGGEPGRVAEVATGATQLATKAMAAAKGPLHALRGTSENEKLLKNAKDELWNENEEIGNYLAIEALAESVGDKDTAKLAREYRRQEEQMAKFLQGQITRLAKAVARSEIPAAERRTSTTRKRSTTRKASTRKTATRSTSRSTPSKRSTAATKAATTRGARKTKASAKRTASSAKRTATSARKTASSARKTAASGGRAASKTVRRSAASARGSKKS
jgi:ferritin-like metal-binding protein YciE